MKTRQRHVHYCDFCKKHGLSRPAMEKHERTCTLNPERECRWKFAGEEHAETEPLAVLVAGLQARAPLTDDAIVWLRDEVGGCPACMLAALRQSVLEYHFSQVDGTNLWDYGAELERFRTAEREAWREDPAIW